MIWRGEGPPWAQSPPEASLMSLGRVHLERLAAGGLLVSEQFPSHAYCPGGFLIHKAKADGMLGSGNELWAVNVSVTPTGVRQVTEETEMGARLRQRWSGITTPLFVTEGLGLWIHGEAERWHVYDGDILIPGGICPSFRWTFDTPKAAVDAILAFFVARECPAAVKLEE